MRFIYQSIWIELPYTLVTIQEFNGYQSLNSHASIMIAAVIEEEMITECLSQNAENQTIQVGLINDGVEELAFFKGYLSEFNIYYDRGQSMLELAAVSFTQKWDITKYSRSFQNLNLTYNDIINQVVSKYPGAEWISKVETEQNISGLILQYEETDWEFLCRLATHFSAYIMADTSTEGGSIYFGIPELNKGGVVEETDYEIVQNIMGHQNSIYNIGMEIMSQENLQWKIISRKHWKLGEQLSWNQIHCQVVMVQSLVIESEIFYMYILGRTDGLHTQRCGNPAIIGLSLPAIIKERSGNRLRVQFKLDSGYETGNNVYYTYAIETVSWYCIPEIGSLVHIYFPTWDESYAIAVHAMQLSSKQAGKKKAVGDKSFTTCDGKEMLFTEEGITFISDESMASTLSLNKDGILKLAGKSITIAAGSSTKIGEATITAGDTTKTVTTKMVTLKSETGQVTLGILEDFEAEELELKKETGIALNEDGNILIKAEKKVYYIGEEKDPPLVTYSDEALKAQDAAQRAEHNMEVMEVREQEGKGKTTFGTVIAITGLVLTGAALVVATGISGGMAAPAWAPYAAAASAAFGTMATIEGASTVAEGAQDLSKMRSGDFSQSFNPALKYLFNDDREAFYSAMVSHVMMSASFLVLALPGAGKVVDIGVKQFLKQAAINTAKQTALNAGLGIGQAYLLDAADGYIDMSLEDYMKIGLKNAAITVVGGIFMTPFAAAANFYAPLNRFFSGSQWGAAGFIGIETAIDMGVDAYASWLNGDKFDFWMSLGTHLTSNAVFSIDPVDVATGGLFLTETDLLFKDIGDDVFIIQRFYNSVIPYYGDAGRKWRFSFESKIILHDGTNKADVFCVDGHTESFALTENGYENKKGGGKLYRLEADENEGFLLNDVIGKKIYNYGSEGELLSVTNLAGNRMEICYDGKQVDKIITFSGHEITITYEDKKVVEICDESGRAVQYKYEDLCLTDVCHVNKGITTYIYDNNANITKIMDTKGNTYIVNEYDEDGRVIVQRYPDGTRSTVTYQPDKRENIVYIEAFDRTERYRYDKNGLITHSYFDDDTCIEYRYDQWQNRTYERDRQGNEINRAYDAYGNLLHVEKPCGQWEHYEYNEVGNLVHKQSAAGAESLYCYDTNSNLISEDVKIQDSVWKNTTYKRDQYGRVLRKKDGEGNETIYEYGMDSLLLNNPMRVIDAAGQEICYEYDCSGRRTAILTAYGRVEISYNSLDLVTYIKDGEGNETRKFYDKAGNLKFMIPPNLAETGEGWSYEYDFFNHLTEICDPLGTVKRTECDLTGKILREIHPEEYEKSGEKGKGTNCEYDRDRNKLRIIYPDGSTERWFYNSNGKVVKHVQPIDYNSIKDDGPGETYEYDGLERLTCIKNAEGIITRKIKYDLADNVIEEIDALGNITYYTYDLLGNLLQKKEPVDEKDGGVLYCVTQYEYDRNSNRIVEHLGLDQVTLGEKPRRWSHINYTYDKLGRLRKVEDGSGARVCYQYDCLNQKTYESVRINKDINKVIYYGYDKAGRLIEKKEELKMPLINSKTKQKYVCAVTLYEYDCNGNCIRITTPKGYQKEKRYDKINRVVETVDIDLQNEINRKCRYVYDRADNLIKLQDYSHEDTRTRTYSYDLQDRLTHFTDESGAVTRIFYDRNGRIEKLVRPENYDSQQDNGPGTRYQYNRLGKVTAIFNALNQQEQENTYNAVGNLVTVLKGETDRTDYVYNHRGDCLNVYTDLSHGRKNGAAQSYTYDARGNITGLQDGNGYQTEFSLDEWGRIVEIHTPEGGVELYTYDYAGNITSSTDANGGTIIYRYNSQGRVSEIVDQDGNSEFFYYDEEGCQETHIDRNGNTEHTRYNMDGQLVYQRAEDKKGKNPVVNQYVYYPNGNLKEARGGGTAYQYEYTETGLLKEKKQNGISQLSYAYNKNGNVSRLTDYTGKSVCYSYDLMDRLEQVTETESGSVLAKYSYTLSDKLESLGYGNGVQTKYQYGGDGKLLNLVTVTPEGSVILDYEYAYDGNGNCIKKSGNQYQNEYAYDCMSRLKEAEYDGRREIYEYDLVGNRLKKNTDEQMEYYTYNAKNQLIQLEKESNITHYTYDYQGNLTEEIGPKIRCYEYDALNRQSNVSVDSDKQVNRYDGEGLRYEVEENGRLNRFLFDCGELVAETVGDEEYRYIRGYDIVFSECIGNSGGYHINDEMGSTLFILDETHNIQKRYQFDAFGKVLEESGDFHNYLTYTGQIYDGLTEQYYLRARFYNPLIGRFLQEDVYRGNGLNLYAYCYNNPIMYYDPSGYMEICPVSWNGFQHDNAGQYTNADMSAAWKQYKKDNNIVGTVRSQAEKKKFLKQLYESGNAPKWMNQWLKKGLVPQGYTVDHKIPLSIGGADDPSNMRLLDIKFHRYHHTKYHPWTDINK